MRICLLLTIVLVNILQKACAEGVHFNLNSGFFVRDSHKPYKTHSNANSGLICLASCEREATCVAAFFNKQTKTCTLYDCKIMANNLVSNSLGIVYTIKRNFT